MKPTHSVCNDQIVPNNIRKTTRRPSISNPYLDAMPMFCDAKRQARLNHNRQNGYDTSIDRESSPIRWDLI